MSYLHLAARRAAVGYFNKVIACFGTYRFGNLTDRQRVSRRFKRVNRLENSKITFQIATFGSGSGIVVGEVILAGADARGDETPVGIAEDFLAKFGEEGIVFFELGSGVDVIVVVIHGPVGIEPVLDAFCPIFGGVACGVALFGSTEDDEHLILFGDLGVGIGGLSIDENSPAVEAFFKKLG